MIPLFVASQESGAFVQRTTKPGVGEQRPQVPREQLLLECQTDKGSGVANVRLHVGHGENVSGRKIGDVKLVYDRIRE